MEELKILDAFNDADFLDLRMLEGRQLSIVLENDTVSCGAENVCGIGVRALVDGCWAFSSASAGASVEEAVERAVKSARALGPGTASVPDITFQKDRVTTPVKKKVEDVDIAEKIADLHHLKEMMTLPHTRDVKIMYNEAQGVRHVFNSMGCSIEESFSHVGVDFFSVAFEKGRTEMASDRKYGVGGYEILGELGDIPVDVSRRAETMLSAGTIKEDYYPVILDPELTGVFAHEALGHCAEADIALERGSFLQNSLNKKITCEDITVIDDPHLAQGSVNYVYDDEGVPAQETLIVEEGVFKGFMHSLETASLFKANPTGNSRAHTYSHRPVIRMTNTYILPGDRPVEEMVEHIRRGVFLSRTFGGEVDTATGTFVFKTQEGHFIEKGECKKNVKNVLVYGTVEEFLRNIEGVGSDFRMSSGTCAKADQILIIGSGGPSLHLCRMKVGVSA